MPAASYIDPRNGQLYPLDQPRWCSDARTPLLVTPESVREGIKVIEWARKA